MNATHNPLRRPLALAALAALSTAFLAPAAFAQVQPERPQDQDPLINEPLDEAEDAFYGVEAGATFTTQYFFRGYNQEDQGFIAQPYVELGIPILVDEERSYQLSATAGQWNSFHSEQTGASGNGPSGWYESDLYGGLTFTTGDITIAGIYTFYTYPNGAASTIEEIGALVEYGLSFGGDDEGEGAFTLPLQAGLFFETNDRGGSEDAYLELGTAVGFELDAGDQAITLEFPVKVGFSIDDYYFDDQGDEEFFGYVSVAATAQLPLPVPERYGDWSLTPGLEALFLAADGLQLANNDDDIELIGSLNVNFEF